MSTPFSPITPMYLKLFFPNFEGIKKVKDRYVETIEKHTQKAASSHPDAGFYLFVHSNCLALNK